jgi:hypothetical protein
MSYRWRHISRFVTVAFLCLLHSACGDNTPWRYNPGPPGTPTGLGAAAGNGQVGLSWSAATNTAAYNVYYATSPGVSKSTATKIPNISSTSTIVTGLTNGVTYYFAVAAINSAGESPLSNEVSATPALPGAFQQSDLEGTWYFNILVNGTGAAWMRGIATIDGSGNVAITSFLDSFGNTTAPANLFTTMTILPDGTVSQSGSTDFHGILSANQYRDMLVGSASFGGATSRVIVILQKRVPGITYSSSDIKGTGQLVAGPLPFAYHQLASGADQEWEYATGQVGQDQTVKYLSINAPTPPPLPGAGNKVVTLSITSDGIVTETPNAGVLPQPTALITWGVMSADKMTIVGTATGTSGAFILRIIHFIHPPSIPLTSSIYTLANLAGAYDFHVLVNGTTPLWAYGNLAIDVSGAAAYATYLDSSGSTALPGAFTLSLDQQGTLTISGDTSYNGHLSYFHDMFVATRTDSPGVYSLNIALKR